MDQETKKRAINQRERILDTLRESGSQGVTNKELSKIALRFQSRLHELYIQGYGVKTTLLEGGLSHYLLIWEPVIPHEEPPKALDVLIQEINHKYGGRIRSDELIRLLKSNGMGIQRKSGSYKQHADFVPLIEIQENPQLSLDI